MTAPPRSGDAKRQSMSETSDDIERLDTVLCGNLHAVTVAVILGHDLRVVDPKSNTAPRKTAMPLHQCSRDVKPTQSLSHIRTETNASSVMFL